MGTTKRLRRHARQTAVWVLSEKQRGILLFGYSVAAHHETGFTSDADERRMWDEHREQLMREFNHPGRRPHAYYKFDLGVDPPSRWAGEWEVLLDPGLTREEGVIPLEHPRHMLSGDHGEAFCASFGDEVAIS